MCLNSLHARCLPIYDIHDIEYANTHSNFWTCPPCLSTTFPFNNIEDEVIFIQAISNSAGNRVNPSVYSDMIYDPFEHMTEDNLNMLDDVDPDHNFLNELRGESVNNCMYHHWDAPKPTKLDHEHIDMSLLHMNIQSLPKKILLLYL
jgi:hypothetical protein